MITYSDRFLVLEVSANVTDPENGLIVVGDKKQILRPFKEYPVKQTSEDAPLPYSIDTNAFSSDTGYTIPEKPLGGSYSNYGFEVYFRTPSVDTTNTKTCHIFDFSPFNLYLFLRSNLNYLRLRVDSSNAIDVRDVVFQPNTDYHIFITFNSSSKLLSLYLDGELKGTFTTTSTYTMTNSTQLRIKGNTRYSDTIIHNLDYLYYFYFYGLTWSDKPSEVYLEKRWKNRSFEPYYQSPIIQNDFSVQAKANPLFVWKRASFEGKITFDNQTRIRYPGSVVLSASVEGEVPNKFYSCIVKPDGTFNLNLLNANFFSGTEKINIVATDLTGTYNLTGLYNVKPNLNNN